MAAALQVTVPCLLSKKGTRSTMTWHTVCSPCRCLSHAWAGMRTSRVCIYACKTYRRLLHMPVAHVSIRAFCLKRTSCFHTRLLHHTYCHIQILNAGSSSVLTVSMPYYALRSTTLPTACGRKVASLLCPGHQTHLTPPCRSDPGKPAYKRGVMNSS